MLKRLIHRIKYGITNWYENSNRICKIETLIALILAITLLAINLWGIKQTKEVTTMVNNIADKYTTPLSLLNILDVSEEQVTNFTAATKGVIMLLGTALASIISLVTGLIKKFPLQIVSYLENNIRYRSFYENFNLYKYKPFLILTIIDIFEIICLFI